MSQIIAGSVVIVGPNGEQLAVDSVAVTTAKDQLTFYERYMRNLAEVAGLHSDDLRSGRFMDRRGDNSERGKR